MASMEGTSFVRLVQVVRVGRVVLVAQAALADQRQPLAVLDWDLWAARVMALLELAARVLAPLELAARVLAPLELDLSPNRRRGAYREIHLVCQSLLLMWLDPSTWLLFLRLLR